MFGRVYENMGKEEFLLRFKDELREPVDLALNFIQKELDQDKPPSPNDVINTITKPTPTASLMMSCLSCLTASKIATRRSAT